MKTTSLITLGALLGSCLIASAEDNATGKQGGRMGPPAWILEKFDTDKDGKLSDSERETMREARKAKMQERRQEMLTNWDKDGDGTLSDDERAAAREARKAEMLEKYDTDGDGKLSDSEKAEIPERPWHKGGKHGQKGENGKKGKKGPQAG